MLFMLDEVMTPREACDKRGVTPEALRMKLKRSNKVEDLMKEGKLKYYKSAGKERGEWLITIEAMNVLFPSK
ncbi:MarR family transcriptional regulator [Bacillus pacificus]|nr:MarR family transcriptional regulator [Bacillus pacificus]